MKDRRCKGYTIYSAAEPGANTTLVDMNGEIVNEWSIFSHPAKMLPGGSILGSKRSRPAKTPPGGRPPAGPPSAGQPRGALPPGDTIEFIQANWDDQEEWSFTNWDDDRTGIMMSRQHHDYQREGNPVGYYAPGQDFVDRGKTFYLHPERDYRLIGPSKMYSKSTLLSLKASKDTGIGLITNS